MAWEPTDEELLSRLKNFEDQFVERKTASDSKDWVKTAVAFANSAVEGLPCVLFIGAKDAGEAVKWFRKAVDLGNARAMYGLGCATSTVRGRRRTRARR